MYPHEPGQPDGSYFRSISPDDLEKRLSELMVDSEKPSEIMGDSEDAFVISLRELVASLGIPTDAAVIYPGSGTHVGVARVFGRENVVHVDPDEKVAESLSKHGYVVAKVGIEEYTPSEPADLIVALNSYGKVTGEIVDRLVRPGGFIIANNHTEWAHDLMDMAGLRLRAAVLPDYRSPEASVLTADQVPVDATEITRKYLKLDRGKISEGTQEDHDSVLDEPRYRDGLFVFERV